MKPFFISIPHSGEKVPAEAPWLNGLPEATLMCDVDRYVLDLYKPAIETLKLPLVTTEWHRYVVDCNRVPEDIDQDSVQGAMNVSGTFPIGFHWSRTTTGIPLLKSPMSAKEHELLTQKYFLPFHENLKKVRDGLKKDFGVVYHIDAHSMPSKGTASHRDPGGERPEIVVSDRDGESASPRFKEIVMNAYEKAGFRRVAYNWPYKGGRITEHYGKPQQGFHTIQIEMNRSLYMDEVTKKQKPELFQEVQNKLKKAVLAIHQEL